MPISLDSMTTAQADNFPESLVIPAVPAGTDALYILEMHAYQGGVNSVAGLGLTWQQKGQIWYAEGTTAGGNVTIAFSFGGETLPPRAAIGSVLHYSGVGGFCVRSVESADTVAEVSLFSALTPYTPDDMALIRVNFYGTGVNLTPQTGYTELLDTNIGGSFPAGMALYSAPLSAPISGVMGYLNLDANWELYAINLIPADANNYYPTKLFNFSLGEESWIVPQNGPPTSEGAAVDAQIPLYCSWVDEPQCGVESGMRVARGYYIAGLNYVCTLHLAFPGKVSFSQVNVHTGPTNGAERNVYGYKHNIRVFEAPTIDGAWTDKGGTSSNTNDDCTTVPQSGIAVENKYAAIRLQTAALSTQTHWASIVALEFVDFIDHDEILLITPPPPEITAPEFHYGTLTTGIAKQSDMPFKLATPGSLAVLLGTPNTIAIGSGGAASPMVTGSANNGATWAETADTQRNDIYEAKVNRLLFAQGLAPTLVVLRNNDATLDSQMFDALTINPMRDRGLVPVSKPEPDGIDVNGCNKFICAGGEIGPSQVVRGDPDTGWVDATGSYPGDYVKVIRWSD
ncbi:MAG: hypothetical protein FOGNACKC_00934 [Anaerolineae bacterium]|nr:hypothetical protein [Anaerolineae bacterium]